MTERSPSLTNKPTRQTRRRSKGAVRCTSPALWAPATTAARAPPLKQERAVEVLLSWLRAPPPRRLRGRRTGAQRVRARARRRRQDGRASSVTGQTRDGAPWQSQLHEELALKGLCSNEKHVSLCRVVRDEKLYLFLLVKPA